MQDWVILAIVVGTLVAVSIGMLVFAWTRTRRTAQGTAMTDKYPQGHWMGIGVAVGVFAGYVLSFLLGILTDNTKWAISFAPAIGGTLGIVIGYALEKKYKDRIRPLTAEEQKTRRWATLILLLLFALGVFAFIGIWLIAS